MFSRLQSLQDAPVYLANFYLHVSPKIRNRAVITAYQFFLDSSTLRGLAAVMRQRGHIDNAADIQINSGQCSQGRFATRSGTLNVYLNLA